MITSSTFPCLPFYLFYPFTLAIVAATIDLGTIVQFQGVTDVEVFTLAIVPARCYRATFPCWCHRAPSGVT